MGLSEENRTLLQLVLGRGKDYQDISGLLGVSEADVRARAQAALADLDPSLPAPDEAVTDYLLGQADAITRADVQRRIADDPGTADTVGALGDQLRLLVPGSDTPGIAPAAATSTFPSLGGTSAPRPTEEQKPKVARSHAPLSGAQRRLVAILLGAALLAVILVLILTGVIGGSDDSDRPSGSPSPTTAAMEPVPGKSGDGTVQFGFSGNDLAANLRFSDLAPTGKGQIYVLWLYGSTGVLPIHKVKVGNDGAIGSQIPLNLEVICAIAGDYLPEMRLSLTDSGKLNRALREARQANKGAGKFPDYVGQTVLKGKISMPQDAKDKLNPTCQSAATSAS